MTPQPPTPSAPVAKLAAKVAHELNNPLDAVLRFVSLAQRKSKSGDYADVDRHLADAQFGLQRMTEILRELMEVGRQSNDTGPMSAASPATTHLVPLADLIAQALHTTAAKAEQKHMVLRVDNRLPPQLALRFNPRLSQVLANLLKNAVDAAPEHSTVHLAVSLAAETTLLLSVEDAGPGIDPELLPQLFTPFVTTKPNGTGHGLGLAISRELVLSLGGTLTLQNRPTTGCLAQVTLPLQ